MHKLFKLTKLNVYIIKMLFLLAFVCVGIFRVGILHGGNFSMGEFLCCHIYRWGCVHFLCDLSCEDFSGHPLYHVVLQCAHSFTKCL